MDGSGADADRLRALKSRYAERLDRARAQSKQLTADARLAAQRLRALERENEQLQQFARLATSPSTRYYLAGSAKKIDIAGHPLFAPLARRVIEDGRTSMDYDRLYTLWQVARTIPPGHPVVEVGTFRGGSARFLIDTFRQANHEPEFYVCDTFSGHATVDPAVDGRHGPSRQFLNTSAHEVGAYLNDYPALRMIVGNFIETGVQLADAGPFALVHLDVDVYPPTAFALDFFADRLAPGASIIVDDYGFVTCAGVKKAVDDFVARRREFRLLHLLTGQAILSLWA